MGRFHARTLVCKAMLHPCARAVLFAALLMGASPAFAKETQAGDTCTAAERGWMRTTGGPGEIQQTLRCDGKTWTFVSNHGYSVSKKPDIKPQTTPAKP